jgi:hypothetical protein
METGLFEIQAKHLLDFQKTRTARRDAPKEIVHAMFGRVNPISPEITGGPEAPVKSEQDLEDQPANLARSFLRLANLACYPLDRLSRYEATLWRQAGQILLTLAALDRCKPWERRARFRVSRRQERAADGHDDD